VHSIAETESYRIRGAGSGVRQWPAVGPTGFASQSFEILSAETSTKRIVAANNRRERTSAGRR